jgi:hypothetical protein
MNPTHQLSPRQRQKIQQLLSTISKDFGMTISNQLNQQLQTRGIRPEAFAIRLDMSNPALQPSDVADLARTGACILLAQNRC